MVVACASSTPHSPGERGVRAEGRVWGMGAGLGIGDHGWRHGSGQGGRAGRKG